MPVRGLFAAIALALTLSVPAAAKELAAELQATLEAFRDRYGFPGATVAVALPDGRVVTAATGLADVEEARPMAPDTPMLAASIRKSFVAAVVLALKSEGRLSQDDPVSALLGDRDWFAGLPNGSAMTVGHLLCHQSGLPDHPHMPDFQQAAGARIAEGGPAFTP